MQENPTGARYLTVAQFRAANQRAIGRTLLYDAIRRGDVPHLRLGRRILIPADALDRLVESQAARRAGEGHAS